MLLRASTPGSLFPSNNSSDAPPPVETWVTLSIAFNFLQHEAVSPPPIIEMQPFLVAEITESITALDPPENVSISNTPGGLEDF